MRLERPSGPLRRILLVVVLVGLLATVTQLTIARTAQSRRAADLRSRIVQLDETTARLDPQVVSARAQLAVLKAEYDHLAGQVNAQVAQIDRLQAQAASLTGQS